MVSTIETTDILFLIHVGDGTSEVKALANLATREEDLFPELWQMPAQGVSMR